MRKHQKQIKKIESMRKNMLKLKKPNLSTGCNYCNDLLKVIIPLVERIHLLVRYLCIVKILT